MTMKICSWVRSLVQFYQPRVRTLLDGVSKSPSKIAQNDLVRELFPAHTMKLAISSSKIRSQNVWYPLYHAITALISKRRRPENLQQAAASWKASTLLVPLCLTEQESTTCLRWQRTWAKAWRRTALSLSAKISCLEIYSSSLPLVLRRLFMRLCYDWAEESSQVCFICIYHKKPSDKSIFS